MVAWREAADTETAIDEGIPVSVKSAAPAAFWKSTPPERSTVTVAPSRLASVSDAGLVETMDAPSAEGVAETVSLGADGGALAERRALIRNS